MREERRQNDLCEGRTSPAKTIRLGFGTCHLLWAIDHGKQVRLSFYVPGCSRPTFVSANNMTSGNKYQMTLLIMKKHYRTFHRKVIIL